ncbi:hypothetical protein C8R42DRAFT_754831, partial [Lentinula raphanica]
VFPYDTLYASRSFTFHCSSSSYSPIQSTISNFNMFFYPLKRQLAIAFAYLLIAGSISVTLSAAIPGSEVSSDGLIRVRAPPEQFAAVSFPAQVDITNAYPVFLKKAHKDTLQRIILKRIAKDVKNLVELPNGKLDLEANNLKVEGSICIFRDPDSDDIRYIVPYNLAVAEENFEGSTLEVSYVGGNPHDSKASLHRKINGKLVAFDLSEIEAMAQLIARTQRYAEVTFQTSEMTHGYRVRPISQEARSTMLLDVVLHVIAKDVQSVLKLPEQFPYSSLSSKSAPKVLSKNLRDKRYVIPYQLQYPRDLESNRYTGGRIEVWYTELQGEPKGRIRRQGMNSDVDLSNGDADMLLQYLDLCFDRRLQGVDNPNAFAAGMRFLNTAKENNLVLTHPPNDEILAEAFRLAYNKFREEGLDVLLFGGGANETHI